MSVSALELGRAIERAGALADSVRTAQRLQRCPRCSDVVALLSAEGFCETCTRIDHSFGASTSRRHVSGAVPMKQ